MARTEEADGQMQTHRSTIARKVIAALLVPVVALTAAVGAGAGYTPTFSDVPPTHPFFTEIEWLADEGITTGFPDGTFRPTLELSRQSMAALLYRYAGEPNGPAPACTGAPFSDVPTSNPFCGEIEWATDNDVLQGFPDGTFRPTDSINRQHMIALLYRSAGSPDGPNPTCTSAPFADVPANAFFCGEIAWAEAEGLAEGFPGNLFKPLQPVTRQTFAAFLYRFDSLGLGAGSSRSGAAPLAAGTANGDAGTTDGGSDASPAGDAAEAAADSDDGGISLPVTGSNAASLAALGLLLAGIGGVIVIGTRRRTATH